MGTVVAVGVAMFFCFCSAGRLLANGGTTDGYVPFERWVCKNVTEKNNRRVGCGEDGKKTVQALNGSF